MRREADALKGHAAAGGIRLREIFKRDRYQRSGGEAHLFNGCAVTDGRWGAGASMADGHDHGVAVRSNFRPELGIVVSETAGLQAIDRGDTGHILAEPDFDLREKTVGAGEAVGNEIDGLAVEGRETR